MRLQVIRDDQEANLTVLEYLDFLFKFGEGKLKLTMDSFIEVPASLNIVELLAKLVESVFPNSKEKHDDVQWLKLRAILAGINSRLRSLNSEVVKIFPQNFLYYRSADSVVRDSVEARNTAELKFNSS